MTMFLAPYTAIADVDGSPLDAGFLYLGEYGKDPESYPIPVYWNAEFTVPAAQPIRTRNGYPMRNGSPAKIYLGTTEHSVSIKNRKGAVIFTDLFNKGLDSSSIVYKGKTQYEVNENQDKFNSYQLKTVKEYHAAGNGTQHTVRDLYTVGSAVYNPRFKNFADVQSFYGALVDSENYLLDQAALEKASIDNAAKGGGIVRLQPGVYFYKRLTLRTGVFFMGDTCQNVSFVCVDPTALDPNVTTHGSSIKKPDDGQRVYRAGFANIFFSTGAAGTGSNQITYQKVLGINLAGCERTLIRDCSFAGFGYGALALARAEGGNEGLGFLNTTHDGNYNVFDNLSFASCGRYNPDSAVIWLKYKANSNKFYSIFAKGCTDAFMLVIDRSNDNFVAGGTLESSKGVAHLGLTTATSGNTIIGIRIESASGDGYIFDTYAENNFVLGGYHTGVAGQDFKRVNLNNRILSNTTNYLRSVAFPPVTNYSTLHNLAALQVSSINGGVSHPLYIKSEEYNNPLNFPKAVFFNDVINLVAGNILGEMAWSNRDTSTGAAGESASIQAVAEGSSGETAVIIKTGTGTTAAERLRVKANGTMVNKVNQTANTLTDNNTMNFELISDTQLRIKVKGSDGVTRSATIALT